jgi:hypothetical protein
MPFATATNGTATGTVIGGFSNNRRKIRQVLTFPNIAYTNKLYFRDAPGKTGTAAQPALISALTFDVSTTDSCKVRFAIWDSTGVNIAYTSEYSPVAGVDKLNISKSVFAGVSYGIGIAQAASTPNFSFRYGVISTYPAPKATYNTVLWNDFNFKSWWFTADNGLASSGQLAYTIDYDVS